MSPPYDALLARFGAGLSDAALSHRCSVTFPSGGFFDVLRETFDRLTRSSVSLPEEPTRSGSINQVSVEEAYLSERGDGIVKLRAPRGFMIGMGETLTYRMLVAGDVSISVEDWWEDNIADPETSVFTVRARSPERLTEAALHLESSVKNQGSPWRDPFKFAPKRGNRARVEAAARAFTDPALAWAALAPANPRWTFVEELFAPCRSCGGTGIDEWYGGSCYGCGGMGQSRSGFRWTPHPISMAHVIGFASDLTSMQEVDAAWLVLLERLAPWGCSATTNIEWHADPSSYLGPSEQVPNCMVPVFKALRTARGDLTIPQGRSPGWFAQGSHAWQQAAHQKPFAGQPNPFEPLGTILSAGYRLELVGTDATPLRARLYVDF